MRTGARELRLQVVCALAPVCLAVAACSRQSDAPKIHSAIAEVEQFAFVLEGSLVPAVAISGGNEISISEPLLVGMYEVTRAEFRAYVDSARPGLDPFEQQYIERWSPTDGALPACFITRDEAVGYARWAGLRLLTSNEWLFCAISPRGLAYPWANSWQEGRANTLELDLAPIAPTKVGTFEGGRTATHLYDMLGNVWEWVADDIGGGIHSDISATVFGGSYRKRKDKIHDQGAFFSESLNPGTRLEDVGFRVCAPARAWLETHAAELQGADNSATRLQAVGRRWGPSAVRLLNELTSAAQSASARDSLAAILSGARG